MGRRYRLELVLAALLAASYAALWHAQVPARTLTTADIDGYLARIDAAMPVPAAEKNPVLAHLRAWGETDDGKPVYMLNLMRYHAAPRPIDGHPEIAGEPAELNARYEAVAFRLLLASGAYPMFAGKPQGTIAGTQPSTNLIDFDRTLDNWSRVLIVRYPDRRAFFELLSHPEYLPVLPYKIAALRVALTPLDAEIQVPDLRVTGALAMAALFFFVAWLRATLRQRAA